ncbi:putative membrane protein [Marinomonas sp. MED121]|uniref:YitT family protein n=1 Tax=Marinomonas sp. MED121 TaxID=314277 RepID=UPI000068FD5E|nr:YitT family protein [Marinomonas sp. MED121]EAQ65484.1 putative membrane protein [Marinomonas sp. MED121]
MTTMTTTPFKHTTLEDVQAILIGTILAALGVNLYTSASLLSGGTAGLAFLAQYAFPFSFGEVFFVINLPFYYLAIRQIGWEFTLKTFASVFLVSFFADITPKFISFDGLNPIYASLVGGFLMGAGFLMLFRHNASLGGLNILARYLAQTRGYSIGKFQMVVDCIIVFMAVFVVDIEAILLSVLGAVALNLILAVNHKPGRYSGF